MFFDPNFPFPPSKKLYYGYIIILCAIVISIVSTPGQTIGISVFTDYFIEALGVTRTQLSVVYMIGGVASAFFLTSAGTLIDKKGARYVAFWTTLCLSLTLIVMSHIDYLIRYWPVGPVIHKGTVLILLGVGLFFLRLTGVGVLSIISRTVILKWFVAARGRVSGIVGIFATLSMSASPPVFNWLIHQLGWRNTYLVLGLSIGLFFSILFWLFIRDTPESCGLLVDGPLFTKHSAESLPPQKDWTLREAFRTRAFWIFILGFNLYSFVVTAVTFNITSIFALAGLSRRLAISVFIPASLVAIIVKLISGYLCDHPFWKDRLKYQLSFYLVAVTGFCLSSIFISYSSKAYYLLVVSLGISTGLYITLSSVCWGSFFGRLHVGRISAYATSQAVFVAAFGPMLYSILFSATGSYHMGLYFSLGASLILLAISFFADKPQATIGIT